MRRFSKLKKRMESLFPQDLDLKIYCTVYGETCRYGLPSPRLWITLNKETIFDFIKDFLELEIPDPGGYYEDKGGRPVYYEDILNLTKIIHGYTETPVSEIFGSAFQDDHFGLSDILKAGDRRIGKKRLLNLMDKTQSQAAKKIINTRLKINGE